MGIKLDENKRFSFLTDIAFSVEPSVLRLQTWQILS